MREIKYSFIMAAYNAEKYIDDAIKSVLCQVYSNWELIIVNDGSIDSTEDIAKRYMTCDSRIKVLTTEHLGTASKARNVALNYLTGDYVQMLDSDDYISDNFLECCNEKLMEYKTDIDILIPDAVCINDEKEIIWEKRPVGNEYNQILNGEVAFMYSLDWKIHGCFLVKSNTLKRIKYDPEPINGDEFTTRKLFYNSQYISFCKGIYYYRKNLESTTLNPCNRVRMLECLITDVNLYHYVIDNHMSTACIELMQKKLIKAIVSYQFKYAKAKKELQREDFTRIEALLSNAYKLININMLCKHMSIHSFLMLLSLKSYRLFRMEINLIARIC